MMFGTANKLDANISRAHLQNIFINKMYKQ